MKTVRLDREEVSIEAYTRGKQVLARLAGLPPRCSREALKELSVRLSVSTETLRRDLKLAKGIGTLLESCGDQAIRAIFSSKPPQSRKAVLRLAATSVDRQHYRIDGVLRGEWKTIAPRGSDAVFDTVAFKEVPSRLWRARGTLQALSASTTDTAIADDKEFVRLASTIRAAASSLKRAIERMDRNIASVPQTLTREALERRFKALSRKERAISRLKCALKLIIKSLWDFPEIQRRKLLALGNERERALEELALIIHSAGQLASRPRQGR